MGFNYNRSKLKEQKSSDCKVDKTYCEMISTMNLRTSDQIPISNQMQFEDINRYIDSNEPISIICNSSADYFVAEF